MRRKISGSGKVGSTTQRLYADGEGSQMGKSEAVFLQREKYISSALSLFSIAFSSCLVAQFRDSSVSLAL